METQTTQTTQTTETVGVETEVETQPLTAPAGEGEGETTDVKATEVAVEDKQETPKLTPVTGVAGLLLVGVIALVVARWRKKD